LAGIPAVRSLVGVLLAWAALAGASPSRGSCGTASAATAAALAEALRPRAAPVVVHVWASWCRPCVAEWPSLAGFLRGLEGRGARLVTLSLDDESRAAAASRVLREARAPGCGLRADADEALPVLRGLDPAWDGALPTSFVLDANGRLVVAQRGVTDTDGLRDAVDRARLPKPDPAAARARRPPEGSSSHE
jgi:thiol-disulfide isomerase/thioredoxin